MTNPTPVDQRGSFLRSFRIARDRLAAIRATAVALLLLLVTAGLVIAVGPKLANSVTDQAEVLTQSEEASIAEVLSGIRDSDGIQLFVAFVETTGTDNVTDYTTALAEDNSLGGNDALLLVAIADRSDALWVGPSLDSVTDDEIDAILVDALEPGLADGDFSGAVIAAARALAGAAGVPTTAPPATTAPAATAAPDDSGAGSGGRSGGIDSTLILIILVVGVGGFLVIRAILKRRGATAAAAAEGDQLNRDANRLLLETDEALKDAANDVEFAAAQWGDAEVIPYREAIRQAGDQLRAAFSIRQRLDDAQPEASAQRNAMLREIVAQATAANQALDAQEQRFDQLQDLERTAPEQLEATSQSIDALRTRRAAATATMDRLMANYAASATGSVTGNLLEADKALEAAAEDVEHGRSALDTKRTDAVVALRRAQDDFARATHLVDAVERLASELAAATARLPDELAAAMADVEAARSALQRAVPSPASPQAVDELRSAEQLLDEARRSAAARPADPLIALGNATAANQAADAIIGSLREAEEQIRRRRETASSAVTSARGRVTRAVDYVTTRRHAVGREARTRVAEAETMLGEAIRFLDTEPERAATTASRAAQLADEAYRLAAAEFDAVDRGQGPPGGSGGPDGHGGGSDLGSAILGGIIGGIISGAGRGGWGGSPWGGPLGGGGAGRRVPGPGPFGGGGGRVGGGGFGGSGGGGGRVKGGRW